MHISDWSGSFSSKSFVASDYSVKFIKACSWFRRTARCISQRLESWMPRDAFHLHDRSRTRRPKSLLDSKSNGLKTDTISLLGICSTILLILLCEARNFCGFDLLFLVQRLVSPRDDFTMTRLYERYMEQKRLHYDTSVLWSVSGKRRL